jgi:hypothetical protein
MRFLICLMVLCVAVTGCKKKIDALKEDLLVKMILSSHWVVTKYMDGPVEKTADFSPYYFQFRKDYTVDAFIDNTVDATGTWSGNIDTKTITSNFPNANPILQLLNGSWVITDSDLSYVQASQTVNGQERFLRLVKK